MADTPTPSLSLRLDLGSGDHPAEGFIGVDNGIPDAVHPSWGFAQMVPDHEHAHMAWAGIEPGQVVAMDLLRFPWPIPTGSVEAISCTHFVEHIPSHICGQEGNPRVLFWQEVFRVCQDRAQVTVVHPHYASSRAFQDPTHVDFIPPQRWVYLDRQWREANDLEHPPYPVGVHMVAVSIAHSTMDDRWEHATARAQEQASQWYWNVIADNLIQLVVVKDGDGEDLPRVLYAVMPAGADAPPIDSAGTGA